MTINSDAPTRGGFWRRAMALFVDALVAVAIVIAIGLLAGALTDGKVRISKTHFFESNQCLDVGNAYGDIKVPEGFRPTSIARCVSGFLGYPYDWYLVVEEETASGGLTFNRTLTFPLDHSGKVANVLYIDWLILIVLMVLAFAQEARYGTTLGKLLMRLRVQSINGGLPNREQTARRLVRFCYLLPYLATYAGLFYFTQMGASLSFLSGFMMAGIALTVLAFLHFAWTTRKGRQPFYDQRAGTEVVRSS